MNQRKFDRSLLVASWFLPTAWLLLSTAIASADQAAIGLLLEPAHLEPEVSQKVAGGENTVMVPARKTKFGFNRIDQAAWTADGLDWAQVQIEARQLADAVSEELEIEWVRDERKVILYGLIQSGNPFAPSVNLLRKVQNEGETNLGRGNFGDHSKSRPNFIFSLNMATNWPNSVGAWLIVTASPL